MSITHLYFLFAGVTLICSVSAFDDEDVGTANKYVDNILENLKKDPEVTKYVDPLELPDFSDKSYKLKNIKVRGLSHLSRYGDCTLSYKNSTVNVIAEVAVSDVAIEMDYSAKALFFWIHGNCLGAVEDLIIMLDISIRNANISVKSMKVTNLGSYSVVSIKKAFLITNWIRKIIVDYMIRYARKNIISVLENEGKDAISNILKETEFLLN